MYMIGDIIPIESEIEDVEGITGKITRYHKVVGYSVGDVFFCGGEIKFSIKCKTEVLENIGLNFNISGDKWDELLDHLEKNDVSDRVIKLLKEVLWDL